MVVLDFKMKKFIVKIGINLIMLSLLISVPVGCVKQLVKVRAPKEAGSKNKVNPARVDLSKYIRPDEEVLEKLFKDLNKDGLKEIVFLFGKPDFHGRQYLSVKIKILVWDGSKYASSLEQRVFGQKSVKLEAKDINKDSVDEILSYQEAGNASILYIVTGNGATYRILKPSGGNFSDFFGLRGAKLKDANNDGIKEIYAMYGPSGTFADIYKWDGRDYKFSKTVPMPGDEAAPVY